MKSNESRNRRLLDLRLPPYLHDQLINDLSMVTDELATSFTSGSPDWDELVRFKASYLRDNILSKFTDASTVPASQRRSAAIAKFLRMEQRNASTNVRLLIDRDPCFSKEKDRLTVEKVIERARKVVSSIIGETFPVSSLDGNFTNGASTRVKRGPVAIAHKYQGEANVTEEAWPLFKTYVLERAPLWSLEFERGNFSPSFVQGSVLFTVPKNSEIDRVACKEPELNMYMQRGVGNYIREALRKRAGIDLDDQTANQRLARQGSASRTLATIDLSSASDLISDQLVRELLPFDWHNHLDMIRVKRTCIDGEWHELNMFSSMGNGFTFELETLVFYSIVRAVNWLMGIRGRVAVYGDDIVTPTASAGILSKVLAFFGLIVNTKKSFWAGSFRESCGRHYYFGSDVSPFFIRKRIELVPDLILVLNQLRAWSVHEDVAVQFYPGRGSALHGIWKKYSYFVPPYLLGGKDVAENSSLVSDDPPRRRLSEATRKVIAPQLGAYLQWHRTREGLNDELQTGFGFLNSKVRVLRNRSWERTLPASLCWWEELIS